MRLSKDEINKEMDAMTLTEQQLNVLNTPPDERWQTSWSAPLPGRSLPKPLSTAELKKLADESLTKA